MIILTSIHNLHKILPYINLNSIQSQMKSDNPLDLSISLSGGKETNKDALSIGE